MEIVLLRHGKPDFDFNQRIRIREVPAVVNAYNHAGVSQVPPKASIDIAQSCDFIVCSDLPRSLISAELLGIKQVHLSHNLYREADIPVSIWPSPRLSPYAWFAFFRLLWFLGHSANGESIAMARQRSVEARQALQKHAVEHGRVLFVGHGLLNHFIAKDLLANRWKGPKRPGHEYWDYSLYRADKIV